MDGATRDARRTPPVVTSAREAADEPLPRALAASYAADRRPGQVLDPVHDPTLPRHRKAPS